MKTLFILSVLAVMTVPGTTFSQASPKQSILPHGTPVRIRLNRAISSADAQVGSSADFETLDDLKVGDLIVAPKGSKAIATVMEAVPKQRMTQGGTIRINIDRLRLPSGDTLPLSGVQNVSSDGRRLVTLVVQAKKEGMGSSIVATAIVGKDITIPTGHEVTLYTNTDYDLAGGLFIVLASDTHITEAQDHVGGLLGSRTAEGRQTAHTREVTHHTAEVTDAERIHDYLVECNGGRGLEGRLASGCQPLSAGQKLWGYVKGGNLVVQIDGKTRTYSILKSGYNPANEKKPDH